MAIDGTIQRFEFTVELYWKTLKRLLAHQGIPTTTPRESLEQAYQAGWLQDECIWIDMLKARNETSHVYDERSAQRIYRDIQTWFPELNRTYEFLCNKFGH